MGMALMWGWLAKAMVKGVEREPGQTTAVVNPQRYKVSTSIDAQRVLTLRKSSLELVVDDTPCFELAIAVKPVPSVKTAILTVPHQILCRG